MKPLIINEHREVWTRPDQKVLEVWLRAHGVDPGQVPHDTAFEFDLSAKPWTCTVTRFLFSPAGGMYVIDGEPAREQVRFNVQAPFPLSAEVQP
jgi:hypothetical protein